MTSSYSGELSTSSQIFYRPDSSSKDYYYFQALRISVSRTGFYAIKSGGSMDTRGYIYRYSFDPSTPLSNLLMDNDDSGGFPQFLLHIYLQEFSTYIVVVTTHREYVTGNFSLTAQGVGSVSFAPFNPTTSQPIPIRK